MTTFLRNRLIIIVLVIGSLMCGAIAGSIFALTHDLPQIRSLESFKPSSTSRIYSADHVLLAELFIERRDPVPLETIPVNLKKALIATEDRKFYEHIGIDVKGILRAIIKDIMAGKFIEGASTITQQLAKTLFLTPQKTLTRKLKEAILSLQLERRYTKNEILELYLNQVYFGSGAYGVEAAARRFFNKSVRDLDLGECAMIAAMPKAPPRYSPLVNPELGFALGVIYVDSNLRNTPQVQYRVTKTIGQNEQPLAESGLMEVKARDAIPRVTGLLGEGRNQSALSPPLCSR